MTALICCATPSESWGRRAPLLPCSTLCRGSVLKSSRHKMAPVLLVSVCFVIFCGYKGMKCITLTHQLHPHSMCSSGDGSQRWFGSCQRDAACDASLRHCSGWSEHLRPGDLWRASELQFAANLTLKWCVCRHRMTAQSSWRTGF